LVEYCSYELWKAGYEWRELVLDLSGAGCV
jgi:hypothetical protein